MSDNTEASSDLKIEYVEEGGAEVSISRFNSTSSTATEESQTATSKINSLEEKPIAQPSVSSDYNLIH